MDSYKCDACVHQKNDGDELLKNSYFGVYCAKGHWDGLGDPDDPPEGDDPWKDCLEFKEIE